MKNQIVLENILKISSNLSANLVILDLSYKNLKSIFKEITDDKSYLQISKSIIKKSYQLTVDTGICCVVATDEKDPKRNVLNPLGTKVIQDIHPWYLSDEIIWNKTPKDLALNKDREKPSVIDFEELPFSQIWILSKQKVIPSRSERLDNTRLSKQKEIEIVDSVWFIQPKSQLGYKDPLPSELLARLILSYSKPNDLAFDPFAGHCVTALVCKFLNRNFLCFTNNKDNLMIGNRRLKKEKLNGYT
ncbi:site-specific DNA-methyltransferase [Candidatus Nitrosotenuis uzonensis]|uniref:Type II methyltransferase n=1 Tax=Candidatus Nitrosotenuis uzonensis TaxID=1407055 RepID=A0A812EW45_9ARCH|nr:site-specific DNA-methyltransferase [Candidatus Nitrosotenuis uzonensis]CAE6485980.1 hypothetical protein NUZ5A_20079 [Candidatus Nitrosotenuis uzonensis]